MWSVQIVSIVLLCSSLALQFDASTIGDDCPWHLPFSTPVGCVSQCPDIMYKNGTECVLTCGDQFVNESGHCVRHCNESEYIISKVQANGPQLYMERKCISSCEMFIVGKHCVDVCLANLTFIDVDERTCLSHCPVDKQFVNTKIYRGKQFKECRKNCNPFILEWSCVNACPEYYFVLNRTCVENCTTEYSLVANITELSYCDYNFSPPCDIIGTSFNECLAECPSDWYRLNNTCVKFCPEPYFTFNKTCVEVCPQMSSKVLQKTITTSEWIRYSIHHSRIRLQTRNNNIFSCEETCPANTVINGNSCLKSCTMASNYLHGQYCMSGPCPDYFYNMSIHIKCVDKCDPYDFSFKNECMTMCPQDFVVFNGTCNDRCPDAFPLMANTTSTTTCASDNVCKVFVECFDECSQLTNNLPYMYNMTCVPECPDQAKFIFKNNCFKNCPPEAPYVYKENWLFGPDNVCKECAKDQVILNGRCVSESQCNTSVMLLYQGHCLAACPDGKSWTGTLNMCFSRRNYIVASSIMTFILFLSIVYGRFSILTFLQVIVFFFSEEFAIWIEERNREEAQKKRKLKGNGIANDGIELRENVVVVDTKDINPIVDVNNENREVFV